MPSSADPRPAAASAAAGPPRHRIERPARFAHCYGCGPDNPHGLAIEYFRDGDAVVATFVPAAEHGGYGLLLHGGITSAVIDETFGWTIYGLLGRIGMTTELSIKFMAPLYCNEPIHVKGTLLESSEQTATVNVEVLFEGRVAASGVGRMRFASLRAIERIGGFKTGYGTLPGPALRR